MSSFIDKEKVKTEITYRQLLSLIWPYTRGARSLLALTAISALILAATGRLTPFIFGLALDRGMSQHDHGFLLTCGIFLIINELSHSAFGYAYSYLFSRFGNRTLFQLRAKLIEHMQQLPMSYFHKNPSGRIITRLTNDVSTLGDVFSDSVIQLLQQVIILFSIVIAMFSVSAKLAIFVLLPAPLFVLVSLMISGRIREVLRESKKRLSELSSFLAENLNGIRVVQLYQLAERNCQRFYQLSAGYRDQILRSIRLQAGMQPVMNMMTAVTISLALYLSGLFSHEEGLSIGMIVAFIMNAQDLVSPLRDVLEKHQQFQNSLTSAERIFQLLAEPTEATESTLQLQTQPDPNAQFNQQPVVVNPIVGTPIVGSLSLRHLNFRYEPSLPLVLKDLSLEFQAGKSYALVGHTGSGKSTLAALIQRLYSAPQASLFVDDTDIQDIPLPELRRQVGVVLQEAIMFRGTIRENMTLGTEQFSETQINDVAQRIGYLDLLKRGSRSLDSEVDEKGVNLSTGERQLIAFTRILLFQPRILILDEATANIDSETEKLIEKAIGEVTQGRTSIIIAHRLSTIRHCHQIFVLDHGKLAESGNHQELLNKGGIYEQMHRGSMGQSASSGW